LNIKQKKKQTLDLTEEEYRQAIEETEKEIFQEQQKLKEQKQIKQNSLNDGRNTIESD